MASKGTVKTAHATSSIRAKSTLSGDRKVVYRPVVDNPLTVTWPPLPQSVRHAILQQLLALIGEAKSTLGKSVADWRLDQHALRRGNTRGARRAKKRGSQGSKNNEPDGNQESRQQPDEVADPTRSKDNDDDDDSPPALLADLVVGINHVTRALESRIRWGRWELGDPEAAPPSTESLAEQGEASPVTPSGRTRKRKRTTSATLPKSRPSNGAPPLGDHPAYAFLREPSSSAVFRSLATGSRLNGAATPPYLLPPAKEDQASPHSWRMLANSDARRLTKPAKSSPPTLMPAHPAAGLEAPAADTAAASESDSTREAETPTVPLVDLVFVCKPDINPPSLVAHLPTMVAAANGVQTALDSVREARETRRGGEDKESMMQVDEGEAEGDEAASGKRPEMRPVLLVPLDVGAERQLAEALGLRRVAAIALSSLLPAAASLRSLLLSHNIKPLSTPWLVPHLLHPTVPPPSSLQSPRFAPTTIKHVKTSAPLNPRAAVQKRKEDKLAKRAAVAEVKRKKRRLVNEARSAGGEGMAMSDDVYVAED